MDKSAAAPEGIWSLDQFAKTAIVPEKHQDSLREKQLETVASITLVIVLANLLNAAIILLSFNHAAVGPLLNIWAASVAFYSMFIFGRHVYVRRMRKRAFRNAAKELDAVTRGATLNGFLWAVAPLVVMSSVETQGQMVMGILMAGMLFAGAFLLSRVPDAAFAFTLPVGASLVVSMQFQQDLAYQFASVLVIVYLGLLIFAVRWSHRQFVEQHLGEAAVNEQSQLIGLLLRDFEESTSDWLWQTGVTGVLEDIPLVLDGGTESASFMKHGEVIASLFEKDEARDTLEQAMQRHQAFRDLVLRVSLSVQDECWVSLTGKPIFEGTEFSGFRGVATDITQSKQIEDRLAHMAHYDALTGLPNRTTMQEHLERLVRHPPTPGAVRALLWMDLDNFKWVNDTLGHPAGDELLRQVAQRISALTERGDMISRLGGDEFSLIIERQNDGSLEEFFDLLVNHMRTPYNLWGSTANCPASFGVRLFDAYTTDTREILKHADLALYDAKRSGKAQWRMFTSRA